MTFQRPYGSWTILSAEHSQPAAARWFWRQAGGSGTRGRDGARGRAILAAMVMLLAHGRGGGGTAHGARWAPGAAALRTALAPRGSGLAGGPAIGTRGRAWCGGGEKPFFLPAASLTHSHPFASQQPLHEARRAFRAPVHEPTRRTSSTSSMGRAAVHPLPTDDHRCGARSSEFGGSPNQRAESSSLSPAVRPATKARHRGAQV